jgi:hypothetical protein
MKGVCVASLKKYYLRKKTWIIILILVYENVVTIYI